MNKKNALITGAASGIGYALSKKLIDNGFNVYSFDIVDPLKPLSGVEYYMVDVTDYEQLEIVFKKINKKFDLLVNNAGVLKRGHYYEASEIDFDLSMKVNVRAPWLVSKISLPYSVKDAVLMQISSKNAVSLKADTFVYSLSKVGVAFISEIVQKSSPLLRVKTAFLGPVDTELERAGKTFEELQKLKETSLISPEKAAELLFDLYCDDRSYLVFNEENHSYEYTENRPFFQ